MKNSLPKVNSVKELVSTFFLNDHGTPFVLTPTQEIIVESILKRRSPDGKRRVHLMQVTQTGKLLSHDTPVLTSCGWKTHGTLCVGDFVFNDKGMPVKVLNILSEDEANLEIEFSNGESIKCHEKHEWIVRHEGWKRIGRSFESIETKKLSEYVLKNKNTYYFTIPNISPIQFPKNNILPVDPYTLGTWLGDGVSTKPTLTVHPKSKKEIIDKIPYKRSSENIHKDTGVVLYNYYRTDFWTGLRSLDIVGKDKKHIPEIYKRTSVEQRLELLAGLIDTDGTVCIEFRKDTGHRDARIYFCNTNERLIDDVVELIRSLGMRPCVVMTPACISSSGIHGKKVVGFDAFLNIPTVCKNKKIIPKTKQRHITVRSITHIEPVKGRCITVEGGVYLVGKTLIPTHNSECVAMGALLLASTYPEKIAIIAPTQSKARIIIGKIIKHAFENEYTMQRLAITEGESIERLRRERSKNRLTFDVGDNKIGEIFILSSEGSRKNPEDIGNALMGHSCNVLILDEAALIDDAAEEKAIRMVGSYAVVDRDFVIKIGNPFRRNHFLKSYRDENYFKINMDWRHAVKEGLVPQRIIDEQKDKKSFKVLYDNKFPEENDVDSKGWMNLFSEDDIERAMLKDDELKPPHVGELRIGNDIARGGSNYTVWCLRSMGYAEILARSKQNNLTEIAMTTALFIKEKKVLPENVFIDEIGVGGGAVDPLKAQQINVRGVNVGNTALEHSRYSNLRAEAYFRLREWLRKGGRLSHDENWMQLASIKYKDDHKGRYIIMSKDTMRSYGIDSPDHADSIALTFTRPEHAMIEERRRFRMWHRKKREKGNGLSLTMA